MTNRSLTSILSLFGLPAVALAALLLQTAPVPPADPDARAHAAVHRDAAQAGPSAAAGDRTPVLSRPGYYTAPVGQVMTFSLRLDTTTRFAEQHRGNRSELALGFAGNVVLRVLASDPQRIVLGLECQGAIESPSASTPEARASLDHIAADLRRQHFVELGPDGAVRAIAFDDATDPGSRTWLRGIVTALHYVVAPDAPETWQTEEVETDAIARWRYARRGDPAKDATVAVAKERIGLVGADQQRVLRRSQGRAEATFDPAAGWFVQGWRREQTEVKVQSAAVEVSGSVTARFELAGIDHGDVRDLAGRALAAAFQPMHGTADLQAAGDVQERSRWAKALQGFDLGSFLADLQTLTAADDTPGHELVEAHRWLQLWLQQDPARLAELCARLPEHRANAAMLALAMSAMVNASASDASTRLGRMVTDPGTEHSLRVSAARALFELGQADGPAAAAVDAALASSDAELWRTGLLLAGALSGGGAHAVALRERLLAAGTGSLEPGRRATWLHAVANTSDPALRDLVLPHLSAVEPAVQVAAVVALARMGEVHALDALCDLMAQVTPASVRCAVVEACGEFRSQRAFGVLTLAALSDPDASVRGAAVTALARWRDPAAAGVTLAQVAASDRVASVRELARAALGNAR